MQNRLFPFIVPVALFWIASVPGCSQKAPPLAETKPEVVTVSQPVVREITDYSDYNGRMAAKESVDVRARVRGYLVKANFQEGEEVKQGDLLFEIDPRPYKNTLDQAEANVAGAEAALKLARSEMERTRLLTTRNASSREELEVITSKQGVAAAELVKTQAAVEQAKLDLNFTKIYAPFNGRISRQFVNVGNLVNGTGAETLLTTIVTMDPIYVYFPVDERSLLRYQRTSQRKTNQEMTIKDMKIPVFLELDGEVGYPHQGVLEYADNRIDPTTGTIEARGVFANPGRIFIPGMRAQVRIPAGEPYRAVLVTDRAVGTDQGLKYVLVVNKENVVERRDVMLGTNTEDGLRVVSAGVKPDEWVIVNGLQRVRPGVKVEPQATTMPVFPTTTAWQPVPATTK